MSASHFFTMQHRGVIHNLLWTISDLGINALSCKLIMSRLHDQQILHNSTENTGKFLIFESCLHFATSQPTISHIMSLWDCFQCLYAVCQKLTYLSGLQHAGQIYIPFVNYLLMILCLIVVGAFQTSERIGKAYGMWLTSLAWLGKDTYGEWRT